MSTTLSLVLVNPASLGRLQSLLHLCKTAHPGNACKPLRPQRIHTDVQPVHASLAQRPGQLRQQTAVGRECQFPQPRHLLELATQFHHAPAYQRLTAGQTDFPDAAVNGRPANPGQFFQTANLCMAPLLTPSAAYSSGSGSCKDPSPTSADNLWFFC